MRQLIRDYTEFFRQFRERFETTGAIAPSSRFLARAMLGPLRQRGPDPVRVLEVGPGTGAVTRHLVRELRPHDVLDIVELNSSFVKHLRDRFEHDPHYAAVSDQTQIHECAIQDFQPTAQYDFIISGLPLNNFPVTLVESIVESLLQYVAASGTISYFEYMYIRDIKKNLLWGQSRAKLRALDGLLQEYQRRYRSHRNWVFINLPPAWVQHLRPSVAAVPAAGS